MECKYGVGDVCSAFEIIEGDSSSKGPSDYAFCVTSVTVCASILFGQ